MKFTDKRRKHRHWKATITFDDKTKFARVYIDKQKANAFAECQKKSAVVKSARITEVDVQ